MISEADKQARFRGVQLSFPTDGVENAALLCEMQRIEAMGGWNGGSGIQLSQFVRF